MTRSQEYHPAGAQFAGSDTLIHNIGRKVAAIPLAGPVLRSLWHSAKPQPEFHSSAYWQDRYKHGNNSGAGSYGRLALHKAQVLNAFVAEHDIVSVAEFGCGDGAQLKLASYPRYTGVDVSASAVALCRRTFADDPSKTFVETASRDVDTIKTDLAMSLDVIYHLVEDEVYETYMRRLTRTATRFICVYSSNVNLPGHVPHIRHRCFTDWFIRNAPQWALSDHVRNAFPYDVNNSDETSWADVYFFERRP